MSRCPPDPLQEDMGGFTFENSREVMCWVNFVLQRPATGEPVVPCSVCMLRTLGCLPLLCAACEACMRHSVHEACPSSAAIHSASSAPTPPWVCPSSNLQLCWTLSRHVPPGL